MKKAIQMNSACYIYGLRAKDSSQYFYVGSTKHSIEQRWKGHREQIRAGSNRNLHFTRVVNSIGVENVVCELIEAVGRAQRFEREAYWIKFLPGLTNILKNPVGLLLSPTQYSADDVERKWLTVKPSVAPNLLPLLGGYINAALTALRVMEEEMERREQAAI